jgi:molybdopterin biosynthesis enzyme
VLPGQESYRIAPMLRPHAWAVLPEGRAEVEAGSMVEVFGMSGPILPDF